MDFMNDIAAMSITMNTARLQQSASIAVAEKAMDSQDLALETMQEMMPQMMPVKGHLIDTYA